MFLQLSVSHSVHRGEVSATPPGRHPQVDTPQEDTPTLADTCLGRHLPRQTPSMPMHAGIHPPPCPVHPGIHPRPAQCMLGYGQQAGGTHPTGMHTCMNTVLIN